MKGLRGTLAGKILKRHLAQEGGYLPDDTLVHDMSGLLAFMGFEAMGLSRVNVNRAFIFNDHNLVGMSPSTAADQRYLLSCAQRYGAIYSNPGNGICHSLYYHDFARPGLLLLGADSHTATCGALGMLGIGMGGIDIAVAMSGKPVLLPEPKIVNIRLDGCLGAGVSAKDAALTLLAMLGIGGLSLSIAEYSGPGLCELSVHQRATLANMGAEAGAISSVFPADEVVRQFMAQRGRDDYFESLCADADADYDRTITLDLSSVEPMVTLPGQPNFAVPISSARRIEFSQVTIGSCTNGSYYDLARAAALLQGERVAATMQTFLHCGSREVLLALEHDGWLRVFIESGVRILECACGPCMGIGQMPEPGAIVLRSTNRNFSGRSGTSDADMYLCSAETAAASAVTGRLTSPLESPNVQAMVSIVENDRPINLPGYTYFEPSESPLIRGANIAPLPVKFAPGKDIEATVVLSLGDGISTDDIVPPRQEVLRLRTNIPALAEYLFMNIDSTFAARARVLKHSVIVAGEDYAQGSSREHAAIACMTLGVEVVVSVSMHRIHRANLINYGVLPLLFECAEDKSLFEQDDHIIIRDILSQVQNGNRIVLRNHSKQLDVIVLADLSQREWSIWRRGGLIPWTAEINEGT